MSYMREYVDRRQWYYSKSRQISHRIGGPAIEWKNGYKQWVLYGMWYQTEQKYKMATSNIPLLYWTRYKMGYCI
jgi:hypothetical protein